MNRPLTRLLCYATLFILIVITVGCRSAGSDYQNSTDPRGTRELGSDRSITTDIRARFADDDLVGIADISPYCYDGYVYLVGESISPEQKQAAITIAEKVDGVRSVTAHILPRTEDCGMVDNLNLAREASARLVSSNRIHGYSFDVQAVQCSIVLLGMVEDEDEIEKAKSIAARTPGAAGVTSYVLVYQPGNDD